MWMREEKGREGREGEIEKGKKERGRESDGVKN